MSYRMSSTAQQQFQAPPRKCSPGGRKKSCGDAWSTSFSRLAFSGTEKMDLAIYIVIEELHVSLIRRRGEQAM